MVISNSSFHYILVNEGLRCFIHWKVKIHPARWSLPWLTSLCMADAQKQAMISLISKGFGAREYYIFPFDLCIDVLLKCSFLVRELDGHLLPACTLGVWFGSRRRRWQWKWPWKREWRRRLAMMNPSVLWLAKWVLLVGGYGECVLSAVVYIR